MRRRAGCGDRGSIRRALRRRINACRLVDMYAAPAVFRLLGDEARLRLLRLLAAERLNVTELTGILGLAQSGVSRHLGLLKEAGLVVEEKDAGFTYYRIAASVRDGVNGRPPLWPVLEEQFRDAAADPAVRADEAR